MRAVTTYAFLAAFMCGSLAAYGQDGSQRIPKVPGHGPRSLPILQKADVAMGGVSALGLSDLVVELDTALHGSPPPSEGTVILKMKGPHKIRFEGIFGGKAQSHVRNGSRISSK